MSVPSVTASQPRAFPSINPGYDAVFQSGRLSLGLVVPIEAYPTSAVPTLHRQLERIRAVDDAGWAAVWLRYVPFHVPSFGDVGHGTDPWVTLGMLAGQTSRIALGVSSIVLPLRHPTHVAKAAASVDLFSNGRLILGAPTTWRSTCGSNAATSTLRSTSSTTPCCPTAQANGDPMSKIILLTGATDGIGLETARLLAADGHRVLLHGRSADKLERVRSELADSPGGVDTFRADLSDLSQVEALATAVAAKYPRIDILINNAGVLKVPNPRTATGLDVRFVVNTLAPVLLTRQLLPSMAPDGRIISLSSAAQATVDLNALAGRGATMEDFPAYAQSKLALTMWSAALAQELGPEGPVVVAINPGSLLNTNMVREGFGRSRAGADVGANILFRAALSDEFADATGRYFDNDSGAFAPPHRDAARPRTVAAVLDAIHALLNQHAPTGTTTGR